MGNTELPASVERVEDHGWIGLLRGVELVEAVARAGQAEVHHAHTTVLADHHVVGLEVAVDEPRAVGRREPEARAAKHLEDLRDPAMAERLLRKHGAIEVHEDLGGETS